MSARRTMTPEGAEALAEAAATSDLVRDGRESVHRLATRRRAAVLRANKGGASYRVIAQALGISVPGVQRLVDDARRDRAQAVS